MFKIGWGMCKTNLVHFWGHPVHRRSPATSLFSCSSVRTTISELSFVVAHFVWFGNIFCNASAFSGNLRSYATFWHSAKEKVVPSDVWISSFTHGFGCRWHERFLTAYGLASYVPHGLNYNNNTVFCVRMPLSSQVKWTLLRRHNKQRWMMTV